MKVQYVLCRYVAQKGDCLAVPGRFGSMSLVPPIPLPIGERYPPHRRLVPPRHDLNALNLKWSESIAFASHASCPPSSSNKVQ